MALRKTSTQQHRPTELTLRSYDVGFGDCFLLSFHYPNFDRHVLIDFGSTRLPEGKSKKKAYMAGIAQLISNDCNGKLHAVVATHRHKDHISGFTRSDGDGPGDIIRELKPDLVIQPWTEDKNAANDALRPTKKLSKGQRRVADHVAMLRHMNEFAEYAAQASKRLRGNHLREFREQLEFLGDDNELANRDAVTNLMNMSRRSRYNYFGAKSGLESILPGVTTSVLGPPTLEQTKSIRKQRSVDHDQFWHLQANRQSFWSKRANIARRASGRPRPLFPRHVELSRRWDMRWYRYQAQREHAESLLSIVRLLDDQMNNTSIILLFEVGDKSLLFPGDAQYENWMYALSQKGIPERLSQVDVYKVGHHGSLNATPKDLWNGFSTKGGVRKRGRLASFLSTKDGVHGRESNETEVPRSTLVRALSRSSHLHDTRDLNRDELRVVERFKIKW